MATITYRLGSAEPLVLRLAQPDGTAPDLTDLAVQLRVSAGASCIILDAARVPDGFEVELRTLDLPPRAYRASVHCDDGAGWRFLSDFTLLIEGGC